MAQKTGTGEAPAALPPEALAEIQGSGGFAAQSPAPQPRAYQHNQTDLEFLRARAGR